ncbi:AMP-binding protein [Taklimakanibacter deserti]|uniref:AMP-binding protein n=1 Tax=Taklimakanibacter deserti TaxID=2267839 RepID=UPI000E65708E
MNRRLTDTDDKLFADRLIATARRDPGAPALLHKKRGVWIVRRWGHVLDEIDRLAAGLKSLGLSPGGQVAVDGEITAQLFLVAAAIRAAGGAILSVPLSASAAELDRVLDDPSVDLVIGQGRDTVARWSEHNRRRIPIVFDHTTPDSRPPADGIVTLANLRTLGEPARWSIGKVVPASGRSLPVTWFEESTDWFDGLDILLDHWVASGEPVGLPELLAAASRDRLELAPESWIASPARLEFNERAIRERLPERNSLAGRLVDGALRGGRAPWFSLTRYRLRNRLGLGRLAYIDVHLGHGAGRTPALFHQLDIATFLVGQRFPSERIVAPPPEKSYPRPLVAAAAAR